MGTRISGKKGNTFKMKRTLVKRCKIQFLGEGHSIQTAKDVTILKGVTIGDDAVIGIRSVVTKDIKPGTLNVGSPSKEIQSGIDWSRINPDNE